MAIAVIENQWVLILYENKIIRIEMKHWQGKRRKD